MRGKRRFGILMQIARQLKAYQSENVILPKPVHNVRHETSNGSWTVNRFLILSHKA